ncbi:ATP-binding protein [Facklamia sp. P12934]|uniref:ATP-binding protein n=1 Tax=Facklamia sp. P12934 TaxID=3421948 RepID=UPI003D16FDD6
MTDKNNNTIKIKGVNFKYNLDRDYEKEGHVYCKSCNEQVDGEVIDFINKKMIFRRACKCDREREKLEKERQRALKVEEIKRRCFVERSQSQYTFRNSDEVIDKDLIRKARNYVEKFEEMKKDNIGLIIYGGVGSGKTYLTCSIVNDIIEKHLYECKVMNFSQILNDLQKGGFNLDRNEYINSLASKTLLDLDDFGIERDTEYALEQVYNVINARYQKSKPTIITTNIDYRELEREQENLMLARIYSRILEMGVPLKVDGKDRRKEKRKDKIAKAKKLIDN